MKEVKREKEKKGEERRAESGYRRRERQKRTCFFLLCKSTFAKSWSIPDLSAELLPPGPGLFLETRSPRCGILGL